MMEGRVQNAVFPELELSTEQPLPDQPAFYVFCTVQIMSPALPLMSSQAGQDANQGWCSSFQPL